jgi:hypothetical protein
MAETDISVLTGMVVNIKFFSKTTLGRMAKNAGFKGIRFSAVGRFSGLWKSMIMIAQKRKREDANSK